jgi:D-alanyl-D-alanine carboxypeptidase
MFAPMRSAIILVIVLFGAAACSTTDTLESPRPTMVAPYPTKFAAIVLDGASGRTLYAANANELRYPASLTKMMTLYLVFHALDAGKLTRDTPIPMTENGARQPPAKLGLKPGQTITVDQAIRALVVKSANDVATALAEYMADGSEERFAAAMTAHARSLGMANTTFRNASGLPDPAQVTTAADMAKLSIALKRRFPHYYSYFSLRSFSLDGKEIRGHNRALDMISGADGIKTGYTRASGFNLATSATLNGRYVVGVVMGEESARIRDQRMADLITQYAR